jgi:hypothetical protein
VLTQPSQQFGETGLRSSERRMTEEPADLVYRSSCVSVGVGVDAADDTDLVV